jgi:GntR family transcriptional regulator/MocR family aminotransferase
MKRAAELPALRIFIDRNAPTPLWRQISCALRALVDTGRLQPGQRLPSSRRFADELHVSRNTILAAYDDLAAQDLLDGRTGAGSFVAIAALGRHRTWNWFQDASGNLLALLNQNSGS